MAPTLSPTHRREPLKRCLLLDLPAELRLYIYHYAFENENLTRNQEKNWVEEEDQDHTKHLRCDSYWEGAPGISMQSNNSYAQFQFFGLPQRNPIALLDTCRTIRKEATAEFQTGVECKILTWECEWTEVRRGQTYIKSDRTYKTFRGEALQDLLERSSLSIHIRRAQSMDCPDDMDCEFCSKEDPGIIKRNRAVWSYLFKHVRRLSLSVRFEKERDVENNTIRLWDIARLLSDECSVENIVLDATEFTHFTMSGLYSVRKEDWIRQWKQAAFKMSQKLPQSAPRTLLWEAIAEAHPDISGVSGEKCKVERISNSKPVAETEKWKNNQAVKYLVKRAGYSEVEWECSWKLLPQWREVVEVFHNKHPTRVRPSGIPAPKQRPKPVKAKVFRQKIFSTRPMLYPIARNNADHSVAEDDVEDDLAFAKAMSKLAVKTAKD